jgi:hypothetical protein
MSAVSAEWIDVGAAGAVAEGTSLSADVDGYAVLVGKPA